MSRHLSGRRGGGGGGGGGVAYERCLEAASVIHIIDARLEYFDAKVMMENVHIDKVMENNDDVAKM